MNIKDYFSFTRGEKRGTVVLLLIVSTLIVANFSVDLFKSTIKTDFSEFKSEIDAFEKGIKAASLNKEAVLIMNLFEFNPNTISDEEWKVLGFKDWQINTINNYKSKGGYWKSKTDVSQIYGLEKHHFEELKPYILLPDNSKKKNKVSSKKELINIEYFKFNPNTISKEEWKLLGFKDWQIKTIFNYKSKGGSWKSKAEIKKIYGLNEFDYNKLEPYIQLPEKIDIKTSKKYYSEKIDINTASAKELTNLKGIFSEKYAALIIKHRNKLGGFSSKEQLKDVWNMTEETYNGFINQVVIGEYTPIKININTSSASQLQVHPFIDWKTANAIFKYRKANGKFKNLEDIKKIHLINKKTYLKIAPYLILE